jgi:hypothetical protein
MVKSRGLSLKNISKKEGKKRNPRSLPVSGFEIEPGIDAI